MEGAAVFFVALVAFPLVFALLAVYVYLIFDGAKALGRWHVVRRHVPVAIGLLATASVLIGLSAALFPVHFTVRVVAGFMLWLLHAQPGLYGLYLGVLDGNRREQELYRSRAEAWLREWEHVDL